jgi:hypothetical protein
VLFRQQLSPGSAALLFPIFRRRGINPLCYHHPCIKSVRNSPPTVASPEDNGGLAERLMRLAKETAMTESYQFILKALQKRLVQSTPITAAELEKLSLSETLNLLYALQGTWGSTGDFSTTFKAISKLVGTEALWLEPTVPATTLVQ